MLEPLLEGQGLHSSFLFAVSAKLPGCSTASFPPIGPLVASSKLTCFFSKTDQRVFTLETRRRNSCSRKGKKQNAAIWPFFSAGRSSLDVCARLAGKWNLYCGYGGCRQRPGVGRRVFVTAAGSDTSQDGENFICP